MGLLDYFHILLPLGFLMFLLGLYGVRLLLVCCTSSMIDLELAETPFSHSYYCVGTQVTQFYYDIIDSSRFYDNSCKVNVVLFDLQSSRMLEWHLS